MMGRRMRVVSPDGKRRVLHVCGYGPGFGRAFVYGRFLKRIENLASNPVGARKNLLRRLESLGWEIEED